MWAHADICDPRALDHGVQDALQDMGVERHLRLLRTKYVEVPIGVRVRDVSHRLRVAFDCFLEARAGDEEAPLPPLLESATGAERGVGPVEEVAVLQVANGGVAQADLAEQDEN